MTAVQRPAGTAGTFPVTPSGTPTDAPVLTIYADAARTVVVVPAAECAPDPARPGGFLGAYPATLPPGTYYLSFSTPYAGGPQLDEDDTLVLSVAGVEVGAGLVDLGFMKAYLGTGGAGVPPRVGVAPMNDADDRLLQSLIDAATPRIEELTGPILPRTYLDEAHDGDGSTVLVHHAPVLAVLSVRELRAGGGVLVLAESTPEVPQADGYRVDYDSGEIVRVTSGIYERAFWPGHRNVLVTYTAGRASVPPSVVTATAELVAHWWNRRRGGSSTYMPTGTPGVVAAAGYGVPNFVRDVLGPGLLRAPSFG